MRFKVSPTPTVSRRHVARRLLAPHRENPWWRVSACRVTACGGPLLVVLLKTGISRSEPGKSRRDREKSRKHNTFRRNSGKSHGRKAESTKNRSPPRPSSWALHSADRSKADETVQQVLGQLTPMATWKVGLPLTATVAAVVIIDTCWIPPKDQSRSAHTTCLAR